MKKEAEKKSDVVIVGAGAAGLFAALSLAPRPVTVLSEKPLGGISASCWAQGGIAAAVDKDDNPGFHAADTLKAAAGTADADVVRHLTAEAPAFIKLLDAYGVRFEKEQTGTYKLSREACHDRRRVLKAEAGDGFGAEMMRALVEAVRQTPSIRFVEGVSAEQLLRRDGQTMGAVCGVLARRLSDDATVAFPAKAVLLATGGIGGLYAATTNPLGAVGRGLAMAARAGAVLSDLEFVQFHPTALDIGLDPAPLATEALRGEGAWLVNSRGERFMQQRHDMAELAPRDVVSYGIFAELQRGQKVYLDCRHINTTKFTALHAACAKAGLDPERDLIPVMPAVHYHMGGISTDLSGKTNLQGLWAAGEVAATGLHGANRLASNSLMEAVVMAGHAARDMAVYLDKHLLDKTVPVVTFDALPTEQNEAVRGQIRLIMSDYVGVIRDERGLKHALRDLAKLEPLVKGKDTKASDMILVAKLIAASALKRTESRGSHNRCDYPKPDVDWQKRSFTTLKEINLQIAEETLPARKQEVMA